ncbi:MAG TPA: hypothetical protein VG733_14145 [Chthoniobacteraceae bacterium]|nr:hypothetical protein [Chthoniobacteraceae bacterium]
MISYSTADCVIQGGLLLFALLLPWILRTGPGYGATGMSFFLVFFLPFFLVCAWGCWHVFYDDPATGHRDYAGPAFIFVVCAFIHGIVSTFLFSIRCSVLHRRAIKSRKL